MFSNCVFETAEKRIKEEDEDFVQLLPDCSPCDGDCTDPLFSTVMSHGSHLTKVQTTDSVESNRQDFTVNKQAFKNCPAAEILATLRSLDSHNTHDTPQSTAKSLVPTECACVIHSVETGRSQLSFEIGKHYTATEILATLMRNLVSQNTHGTPRPTGESSVPTEHTGVINTHHSVEPGRSQDNDNKYTKLHKVPKSSSNAMDPNSPVSVIHKSSCIEPSFSEVSCVGRKNAVEMPQSVGRTEQPKECQLIKPSTSEGSSGNMNNEGTLGVVPERSHSSSSEKRHRCNVCGKMFRFRNHANIHMTIHTGEKPYKCSFCDRTFAQKWYCEIHELSHKGELPQCPVCGGRYVHLKSHMLIHSDNNYTHICSVCKKAFRKGCDLRKHMLIHTGEKPYTCHDCGGRFRTSTHLKIHMVVHTGPREKNHVCSLCGKMFTQSGNLRIHMRTHTDERPHRCETCGKGFKQISGLVYHQTVHSSEKRFVCSTCGKQFKRNVALWRHKLIHTGEQPYECSVCRMRFNQSSSVKRHMLVHTGEKPYSCSDCGERFTQSGGLNGHRRRHCPVIKNSQN